MKEKNNLRSRDWDHTMESKSKKITKPNPQLTQC
jgi:hypothetical protein